MLLSSLGILQEMHQEEGRRSITVRQGRGKEAISLSREKP